VPDGLTNFGNGVLALEDQHEHPGMLTGRGSKLLKNILTEFFLNFPVFSTLVLNEAVGVLLNKLCGGGENAPRN
jgi:hypothetical protein